ncbi:MAG: hypothetical protein M0T70_04740 [Geobacteraceae bacterium]|nr:hypothetical protein [Geobacteraceae bacterium]
MSTKITIATLALMIFCIATGALSAAQTGTADTVFNRRFYEKMQPMMPYSQLVKMIGAEGINVGDVQRTSPPVVNYHWNGGRKSLLDARVVAGKVVGATVTSPKGRKFSLDIKGK